MDTNKKYAFALAFWCVVLYLARIEVYQEFNQRTCGGNSDTIWKKKMLSDEYGCYMKTESGNIKKPYISVGIAFFLTCVFISSSSGTKNDANDGGMETPQLVVESKSK